VEIDGKPAATLKAGQHFLIPAGRIHNATNKGTASAKVLATYVVSRQSLVDSKGRPVQHRS
jgi:quercetin dioxygenase-like cupin family protein